MKHNKKLTLLRIDCQQIFFSQLATLQDYCIIKSHKCTYIICNNMRIIHRKDVNMLKKLKTGKIIKKRRKELGMSADDLAKSIGKDRSTVYRYESGDISKLSIDMLEPLADALKTDIAYLLGLNRCDTASVTIRTETVYAAYASTNKAHVQRLKKWVDYFGNEDFTEQEFDEIVSFANYLLHKRKSKGGDK